jgi:hypothetical protein
MMNLIKGGSNPPKLNDDQLTKDTLREKIKKFPTNQEFRK